MSSRLTIGFVFGSGITLTITDNDHDVETGTQMPDVLGGLYAEVSRKVQNINARNSANTLWTICKTGTHKLEVLETVLETVHRRAAQLSASRSLSELSFHIVHGSPD